MKRRAIGWLAASVCALSSAFQLAQGGEPAEERIEILSGGKCLVRGRKLDCPAVAAYLRDQLKLGRGQLVRVRAGPSIDLSYPQLHALFESLKEAGFSTYAARAGHWN